MFIHDQDNYDNHQLQYPSHEFRGMQNYSCIDLPYNCEIISLLKDITEDQAKEIIIDDSDSWSDDDHHDYHYRHYLTYELSERGIDTSLNWLLLKKI